MTGSDDAAQGAKYLEKLYALGDAAPAEAIRATYDAWAATYEHEILDDYAYAMPRRASDALAQFAGDLGALEILDVGCGTGLVGAALQERGARVLDGCDFSPGMLAQAAKRGLYRRLFEADLNAPPLAAADAAYDAAIAAGVFAAAHIDARALDELVRVVKPGGLITVTTNERYYKSGALQARADALAAAGRVETLESALGDHLPGRGVGGWVVTLRRRGD